jgi:hypothetical protein
MAESSYSLNIGLTVSNKHPVSYHLQMSLGAFIDAAMSLCLTGVCRHAALESRVLAGYVAGASMLIILAQAASMSSYARGIRHRLFGTDILAKARESIVPAGSYVSVHGGWTILLYQMLRFAANLGLLTLIVITAVLSEWSVVGNIALVVTSVSVHWLSTVCRD